MIRGLTVVITAIMSVIFLKRKQYLHHWLSLTSIVVGVFIVGLVGVTMSKKSDDEEVDIGS
jgi:drug/metabolite transporter (DMT)-like permease